ncbi:MAG: hypothetical protein NTZ19_06090 [Bacteroidetes bacterium]|nr:hypothetical protein [Bacteroidota bacterium]
MDISRISYNDHTLFHMLRHFECINENARNCLLERGYTNAAIDANLAIPGSKFHKDFATDIKSLLAQCIGKEFKQVNGQQKYLEFVLKFETDPIRKGVGTLGLCNKKDLNDLKATSLYQKMNRNQSLWHATVREMPTTVMLTIIIKRQVVADFLITSFPGLPTVPLPNKKMNKSLLELAKNYWNEKVFLEEDKEMP